MFYKVQMVSKESSYLDDQTWSKGSLICHEMYYDFQAFYCNTFDIEVKMKQLVILSIVSHSTYPIFWTCHMVLVRPSGRLSSTKLKIFTLSTNIKLGFQST